MTLSSTNARELAVWAELNAALAHAGVSKASARLFLRDGLVDGSSTEASDFINGASGSFDVAKIVTQLAASDRGELAMRIHDEAAPDAVSIDVNDHSHAGRLRRMNAARGIA